MKPGKKIDFAEKQHFRADSCLFVLSPGAGGRLGAVVFGEAADVLVEVDPSDPHDDVAEAIDARPQEQPHQVRVAAVLVVGDAGGGVHVQLNSVAHGQLEEDALTDHSLALKEKKEGWLSLSHLRFRSRYGQGKASQIGF